ncbi:hypothetical protein BDV96DRAFT_590162 [Lophiotrema nucula]|uniref:Uncharacterized protein n=1 Tax=Lophiotrema nucula TaxID=690887 RepID=A0A6A5YII1_9PLEO|nr:hypothetical protein BDV96DRAFT_590162 [Lophiotrema nucula]
MLSELVDQYRRISITISKRNFQLPRTQLQSTSPVVQQETEQKTESASACHRGPVSLASVPMREYIATARPTESQTSQYTLREIWASSSNPVGSPPNDWQARVIRAKPDNPTSESHEDTPAEVEARHHSREKELGLYMRLYHPWDSWQLKPSFFQTSYNNYPRIRALEPGLKSNYLWSVLCEMNGMKVSERHSRKQYLAHLGARHPCREFRTYKKTNQEAVNFKGFETFE